MSGSYGVKVSPVGQNVQVILPKDAQFDSDYAFLKVFKWFDIAVTTDGSGDGSNTRAHNLNYAPAFFVFRKGTAQWTLLDPTAYSNAFFPLSGMNLWAGEDHPHIYAYADDTNFGIEISGATPSTTYNFRVYILVDNSKAFSGAGVYGLNKNIGFKASKPGIDVKTGQEYDMVYSSKYKSIQYYDQHKLQENIALPEAFASIIDDDVQEGSYIDFVHNLGYPPFFIAYFESNSPPFGLANQLFEVPFTAGASNVFPTTYNVAGFSDADKVRISFWRGSFYSTIAGLSEHWMSETITVKILLFTENLLGDAGP